MSPIPVSTARHCPSVNRRASPAAVVEDRPGHRGELLPGDVGALAVQPDQEVLPGQLRGRHPDQQLCRR